MKVPGPDQTSVLLSVVNTYSWQRGSSKQSVLRHPRSGGGEVWSGPVVQVGKQGSKVFKEVETKLKQKSCND